MRPQAGWADYCTLSRSAALLLGLGGRILVLAVMMTPGVSHAQTTSASQLNFGAWHSVPGQAASEPTVRTANFQSPGFPAANYMQDQLPPLPGAISPPPQFDQPQLTPNQLTPNQLNAPPQPSLTASAGAENSAGMPPQSVQLGGYNQFSNPGGAMAPTQVMAVSGTGMRQAQDRSQSPASVLPPQPGYRPAVYQDGAAYGQMAYGQMQQPVQQPVLPPGGSMLPPGGTMRPATVGGGAVNPPVYTPGPGRELTVVSQDPRFISPPVRAGNFATYPYQAPLRTVAYQTNSNQPPLAQQPVLPPLTVPNQPQVVANTSSLPQFQPTVGTRLASYPGYQTGFQGGYPYCPPNLPAGGVPSVVPGAVAPPTLTPNMTPQLYSPDNSGFKPLFSLGQENYNVMLGRGIIGQPTAYVPGQPVRNFMRYIFP